ncbi:putative NADP-dependent mannitol dehydrogenase [Nocardia gamkensis]|uniref:3-oxoacyl-[acyl-carrier-protein] reductase MabA n=1 Tax=Nocardia gamkensis TaxID=352869 RepID=A0A7X6L118_9NOCA|nr:SDR family oxidoreductase [Nocardia gamkensis]NQE68971.1 putative NADP-dependent mannitol dehydrogenase [Nocardia gamkensis]
MDLGLRDAATVVVGGSRGMGLATARCLAEEGARVAVVGRSLDDVERAAEDLAGRGSPDAVGLAADVREPAEVESVFARLERRWGGELNALINTVGPNVQGTAEELSDEQWREAVDHGVLSIVRCVNAALPLLRSAAWGRIVNFSAHSTQRQAVNLVAYTAAKAMVTSVSKNLSLLLAREEILVNVVSPGTFVTPGLTDWARSVGIDSDDPYRLMEVIGTHYGHPAQMPRAGLPEEIGPVAAFLASRRNSYMTGANVNVDGGSDFVRVVPVRSPELGTTTVIHTVDLLEI